MRNLSFDTLFALSSLLGLGHAFQDNAVADEIVLKIVTVPITTWPIPTTPPQPRSSTPKPVSDLTTTTTRTTAAATVIHARRSSYSTPSSWATGTDPTHTTSGTWGNSTISTVSTSSSSTVVSPPACTDHWLAKIDHQGFAPYVPSPSSYKVFRNVKDFGAEGDGESDDTEAINRAISEGGRCGPGTCDGTTISPAVVYFPPGTYLVTSPIIDYYFTQIYGNPDCMPVIKAAANFTGAWVLDANQYQSSGLGWGSTNVFWRQVRNLVIDLTGVSSSTALAGIHWPSSQATSLQNILIKMSSANDTQQYGMLIEEGSGGYIGDMVFQGKRPLPCRYSSCVCEEDS